MKNEREAEFDVDEIFLERWSPRSLSNEMNDEEFNILLEAARWALSNSNSQPWRFLYAKNGSKNWERFFGLLAEFNQLWAKNAAYLVVLISRKSFEANEKGEEKENKLHMLGAGSALMSLALQARMKGWIAHGMAGFDYEKTREELKIPEDFEVDCMIAVGKQGEISSLPERMQQSEKPNSRKSLKEISHEGNFPEEWK